MVLGRFGNDLEVLGGHWCGVFGMYLRMCLHLVCNWFGTGLGWFGYADFTFGSSFWCYVPPIPL